MIRRIYPLLLVLALAACGGPAPNATAPARAAPTASEPATTGTVTPRPAGKAPSAAFAVGVRTLDLRRGSRALPTTIWYPATGGAGSAPRKGVPAAAGRFPVVIFSHGLHGLPEYYAPVTTRWAAAGFVVAAPAYPNTNGRAARVDLTDVVNQPADADYVLGQVLALSGRAGDLFAGHLDAARAAAVGHSAGGYTTAGMFGPGHDRRLRAGVVISGGTLGPFGGSSAAMLFVHGDKDPTVPLSIGRYAYDKVTWSKAFLTLLGQGHTEFLVPFAPGFAQTIATTTDFLRWTLYGDAAARARLARDGTAGGVSTLTNRL